LRPAERPPLRVEVAGARPDERRLAGAQPRPPDAQGLVHRGGLVRGLDGRRPGEQGGGGDYRGGQTKRAKRPRKTVGLHDGSENGRSGSWTGAGGWMGRPTHYTAPGRRTRS